MELLNLSQNNPNPINLSNRCICGKLKQKYSPLCVFCYRKIDKQCRICINHEIFHDSKENEYYDVCKLHKMTDWDRLQCQEHQFIQNNRRIIKRVMAMIQYYNKYKQFFDHYVIIKTGVMVHFQHSKGSWDFKFFLLEHYTKEGSRIG